MFAPLMKLATGTTMLAVKSNAVINLRMATFARGRPQSGAHRMVVEEAAGTTPATTQGSGITSQHMTQPVEWFRVGRQVYACPPYALDELRRWVAEYGEIPDLSGMPLVKPRARPPSHLNLRLIEDLTPPQEKAERSTPPAAAVSSTEQAAVVLPSCIASQPAPVHADRPS
jgi:hypothetical protein